MEMSDLFEGAGISFKTGGHRHARPGWLNLDCPFCAEQSKYHLGYSLSRGMFNCWRCGPHSSGATLAMLLGISEGQAWQIANGIRNLSHRLWQKPDLVRKLEVPLGIGPMSIVHKKYLSSRGIDPDRAIRDWDLKAIRNSTASLSWRIFIPFKYRDVVVGWTTRSIRNAVPRYLNAKPEQEAMDTRNLLMGEDYCRSGIVVTEGPMDMIRIGPGAVCLLGSTFSQAQLSRIARYPIRAVCLDSHKADGSKDLTARKMAIDLAVQLSLFPGETYNITLDCKDPGAASDREIRQIREHFLEV